MYQQACNAAVSVAQTFIKWDYLESHVVQHFAESAVRATSLRCAPMHGAVVVRTRTTRRRNTRRPQMYAYRSSWRAPPHGRLWSCGVKEVARRLLVAAEKPVLVLDRYGTNPAGLSKTVEFAVTTECCRAPVIDNPAG